MLYESVLQAAEEIRNRTSFRPKVGIILGSGLGAVADRLEGSVKIAYAEIPGFPASAVAGHAAQLVFGRIGQTEVVAMQGRFHYYEGLSMKQVAFPVFVLRQLGVQSLIITNSCGGINTIFAPGDFMLIANHINLSAFNPLIGPNEEAFGPRFPDMTEVYNCQLRGYARRVAERLSISLKEGVYAFFPGPCYETAAEIRAYQVMGADAIGMSTVPEATAAKYLGMDVLGIACITNMATGIAKTAHSHEEVLAIAEQSSQSFCHLIEALLSDFPTEQTALSQQEGGELSSDK
jgi:purine-nucleoside phosphorylase